jgi:hypothetical protein
MSKYKNVKTVVDGIKFASKREAARWCELVLLERAGQITELRRQEKFVLAPSVSINGRKAPALRYFADFVYRDASGQFVIEDVKGAITDVYRVKRHLMAVAGHRIVEVR